MASNIVSESIDAEYPVAGVDNDTQGFRDNFSIIKDNFAAAKSEIEDLQDNAARKDEDNNFLGSSIIDVDLDQVTEKFISNGNLTGNQNISFINGLYQTATIANDNIELTLADWPNSGRLAKMSLEIINDGTVRDVTIVGENNAIFKTNITDPNISSKQNSNTNVVITIGSDTNPAIVEFWTYDAGNTIYFEYKGVFSDSYKNV